MAAGIVPIQAQNRVGTLMQLRTGAPGWLLRAGGPVIAAKLLRIRQLDLRKAAGVAVDLLLPANHQDRIIQIVFDLRALIKVCVGIKSNSLLLPQQLQVPRPGKDHLYGIRLSDADDSAFFRIGRRGKGRRFPLSAEPKLADGRVQNAGDLLHELGRLPGLMPGL